MARSNSPAVLERWANAVSKAPYRASIDGDACWNVGKPSPNLAKAMRVSPGGRLLAAFDLEDLRDHFVEGHIDQGAQAESDGVERASARRPRPDEPPLVSTLNEAFAKYEDARLLKQSSENILRKVFVERVKSRMADGDVDGALALIASMPRSTEKDIAITHLIERGDWNYKEKPMHSVSPEPYSSDRAAALLAYSRADRALNVAIDQMNRLLQPLVDDYLSRGDREALAELIERTPASFERAAMMDALRHRMPPEQVGPKR